MILSRLDPSRPWLRRAAGVALASAALAGSTALVALAEASPLSVPNAAPLYLLAVVGVGVLGGAIAAVATAIAAFVVYDLLFVEPHFTLAVADPGEWLNLLVLLFVGVVIGRLTALQGERATDAARRARENAALFRISRMLSTSSGIAAALPAIVADLVAETRMDRVWVALGEGPTETVIADSSSGERPPTGPIQTVLRRTPGDQPAIWVRAHEPAVAGRRRAGSGESSVFRVKMEAEGRTQGSLWATRLAGAPMPGREETRLLALAADQIALGIRRERLTGEANAAEAARQGEALKTALLESVSHDLRTPLASIRATAGSLMDPAMAWTDADRRAAAGSIDAEAQRLNGLVRNLLDLGRIEGGALRPELEAFDLASLVEPVVARLRPLLGERPVTIAIDPDLPPVSVDAVHLDAALTNLLENAARHAPGAAVRIAGGHAPDGRVVLRVEDAGPGVPEAALGRLFDRFARLPSADRRARRGLGLGLSVVRGLVETMGGEVRAGRGDLGGLAVDLVLAAADVPSSLDTPVGAP